MLLIRRQKMRSTVVGRSWIVRVAIPVLLLGVAVSPSCRGNSPGDDVLTDHLSEPLNGVTQAKLDIDAGDGNLAIDRLTGGEPVLAAGTLEYLEKQGQPARTLVLFSDQADLELKAGKAEQGWIRLPWAACNGATEWLIHLNPTVAAEITAHSDGGNLKLDLDGMVVTGVAADTGGGNVEVVLPDATADLHVTARTGAGNVTVSIPSGVAARIHATTGLGKTIVDPRYVQVDDNTYQSPGYDAATGKVEITLDSGAGNVIVSTY
jgi:hypothetical protein